MNQIELCKICVKDIPSKCQPSSITEYLKRNFDRSAKYLKPEKTNKKDQFAFFQLSSPEMVEKIFQTTHFLNVEGSIVSVLPSFTNKTIVISSKSYYDTIERFLKHEIAPKAIKYVITPSAEDEEFYICFPTRTGAEIVHDLLHKQYGDTLFQIRWSDKSFGSPVNFEFLSDLNSTDKLKCPQPESLQDPDAVVRVLNSLHNVIMTRIMSIIETLDVPWTISPTLEIRVTRRGWIRGKGSVNFEKSPVGEKAIKEFLEQVKMKPIVVTIPELTTFSNIVVSFVDNQNKGILLPPVPTQQLQSFETTTIPVTKQMRKDAIEFVPKGIHTFKINTSPPPMLNAIPTPSFGLTPLSLSGQRMQSLSPPMHTQSLHPSHLLSPPMLTTNILPHQPHLPIPSFLPVDTPSVKDGLSPSTPHSVRRTPKCFTPVQPPTDDESFPNQIRTPEEDVYFNDNPFESLSCDDHSDQFSQTTSEVSFFSVSLSNTPSQTTVFPGSMSSIDSTQTFSFSQNSPPIPSFFTDLTVEALQADPLMGEVSLASAFRGG